MHDCAAVSVLASLVLEVLVQRVLSATWMCFIEKAKDVACMTLIHTSSSIGRSYTCLFLVKQ